MNRLSDPALAPLKARSGAYHYLSGFFFAPMLSGNGKKRPKVSSKSSPDFRLAIERLHSAVGRFGCVDTCWKPRHHAVARFGH